MLEGYFVFTCTLYSPTVDEYNNPRATAGITTSCHFRDGRTLGVTLEREELGADAMAWFRPSEIISEGTIVTVDSNSYRVTKVIKARRLGNSTVQFLKCWLERFDSFVS